MIYYIYCITNQINNKTYIGQRKCPANKTPETDSYMGSGTILHQAYEKYGIENFSKSIFAICETSQNADILEKVFIALYRSEGKAEYNICDGGQIRFSGENAINVYSKISNAHKGKKLSEEHKKKISESNFGKHFKNDECRQKISLKNKGRKFSEDFKNECRNRQLGKHHSEETRLKMSLAKKGIKKTPEQIKLASEAHKGVKHKPFSEQTRLKMSLSRKGHFVSEETKRKLSEATKLRYERLKENGTES